MVTVSISCYSQVNWFSYSSVLLWLMIIVFALFVLISIFIACISSVHMSKNVHILFLVSAISTMSFAYNNPPIFTGSRCQYPINVCRLSDLVLAFFAFLSITMLKSNLLRLSPCLIHYRISNFSDISPLSCTFDYFY